MSRTITQTELRNGSSAVMDALEAGEEFIVTCRADIDAVFDEERIGDA